MTGVALRGETGSNVLPGALGNVRARKKILIINLPIELQVKAGNPAVSSLETRGFPTLPRDSCGFFNFPLLTGKQALTQVKR